MRRRRPHVVGVIERRDPLPTGRYYTLASGDKDIDRLDAWLRKWSGSILLEDSKFDPGTPGPFTNPVPSQWVLFSVRQPIPREGLLLFVATPNVTKQTDVYPDEPSIFERAEKAGASAFKDLEEAAKWILIGVVVFEILEHTRR